MANGQRNSNVFGRRLAPSIGSSAMFRGISDAEVRIFADHALIYTYSPKEFLYTEGQPAHYLYLVESGVVRLGQVTPEGEYVLVDFKSCGDVFGYLSLAGELAYPTAAQTVAVSRILSWNAATALCLLHKVPRVATNLFGIAARDIVFFAGLARKLKTEPVSSRVQWALGELARKIGSTTPNGSVIEFDAGQRYVAEMAGTTIFTVSRELSQLERRGIIRKSRGRILVVRPDKLAAGVT